MQYSAEELEEMPTLATGQTDDLKIDTGSRRVWLSRSPNLIADGGKFKRRVMVERLICGKWQIINEYEGAE
jgi:hypothetical protein